MPFHQRPEITADDVQNAGQVLEQILERDTTTDAVSSPALEQLAVAKREPDRITRLNKVTQALKQGAADAQAAQQRLRQSQQEQGSEPQQRDFTPEAMEELEALKVMLRKKVRQRAEEELARSCPEIETGKKRRAPRRNRISI